MSDTPANRMAGGPIVYAAPLGVALPSLAGNTIDWASGVNESQTITKTGTVSGGTATIEVVYPNGTSETTAAIAYDATAATIKTALANLNGLTADDLTVTGGPFSTNPVVITFGGQWASTAMGLCIVNYGSITGGGSLACARTATGTGAWLELPDVVKDVKEKGVHKVKEHRPAFSPHPTGSTTVSLGVESIMFDIEESDLDAMAIGLADALTIITPASAGVASSQKLRQPLPADADANMFQVCLVTKGPQGSTGWGMITHYYRVKRILDDNKASGQDVRTLGMHFEVYADPAQDYRCVDYYEYLSAATS